MTARDVRDALHQACWIGLATEYEAEFRINAYRAEVLREAAELVSLHVDLGAPPQRILTELRRMADAATPTSHSCGNCDGVDPDSCLTNPDRAAAPTSKEN